MEDNNLPNNEPSTESDVKPGGGALQEIKKKISNIFGGVKDAASRGIRAIWKALPLQIKAIVIVVIIVVVTMLAALLSDLIKESTKVVTRSVDEYFDSSSIDAETKKIYEEKKSLVTVKLTDLNAMYDQFVKNEAGGAETKSLMKYEIGEKDLSASEIEKRIVDVDDKLPMYKHILLTEKYNFNKIKWRKFSHTSSWGADLADSDYNKDLETGLKYPKDSKDTKLEKFVDLAMPYLQTWYIPLSMHTASIVSGNEEDSNRSPLFSYNVIKEAYSNIVVNWYELQKCKVTTKYETFDEVTKHDIIDVEVVEYPIPKLTSDSRGITQVEKDSKGNIVFSGNYQTQILSKRKVDTVKEGTQKVDTSTIDGKVGSTKSPMKEEFVSKTTEVSPTYYISQAETFDVKIINEFNYEAYLDSDVDLRQNSDSKTESTSALTKESISVENKAENVLGSIALGTINSSAESILVSLPQAGYTVAESGGGNVLTTTIAGETIYGVNKTYTVNLRGYTEYENCLLHTVERTWNDSLRQSNTKKEKYTLDDLIAYNESDDRKEKVSASAFCGASSAAPGTVSSGTSIPTTEIYINGKKYPVFAQTSYGATSHGGTTIGTAGCGLCSITTVIGAITNKKVDPISVGNDTNWTGAKFIYQYAEDLKNVFGINCTYQAWGQPNSSDTTLQNKKNISKPAIDNNLKNGNPVIIQVKGYKGAPFGTNSAHYVALLGYENGMVVVANSAGGKKQTFTLDQIIDAMYDDAVSDNGYILVNPGNSSNSGGGSSSSQTSGSSSSSSNTSSASSDMQKKMQDMINFAVSFPERGKTIPYGAPSWPLPSTKEELENVGVMDCSGFVTSLYKIFFDADIAKISIMDLVATAPQINENGLKGQNFTYDQSKGSSQLQVGDILHNPGHVTMYIGEYNGVPSLISQGKNRRSMY